MTTTAKRQPPIKCTPCQVTYKQLSPPEIAGRRFHISSIGVVRPVCYVLSECSYEPSGPALAEDLAKLVRHEASRQRRNRNARERNQAMRDLGMRRTPYGWE